MTGDLPSIVLPFGGVRAAGVGDGGRGWGRVAYAGDGGCLQLPRWCTAILQRLTTQQEGKNDVLFAFTVYLVSPLSR